MQTTVRFFDRSLEYRIYSLPAGPIDPEFIPSRSPQPESAKPPAESSKPIPEESLPEFAPEREGESSQEGCLVEPVVGLDSVGFEAPLVERATLPEVERETEAGGGESKKDEPEKDKQARERIALKPTDIGGGQIDVIAQEMSAPTWKDGTRTEQPKNQRQHPPLRSPSPAGASLPLTKRFPPARADVGNLSEHGVRNIEAGETGVEGNDFGVRNTNDEIVSPTPLHASRTTAPSSNSSNKASTNSVIIPSQSTTEVQLVPPTPLDYVVIDKSDLSGSIPPPSPRTARPSRAPSPLPIPSSNDPDDTITSQSGLKPIPSSSLDVETETESVTGSSRSLRSKAPGTRGKTVDGLLKEGRQRAGETAEDRLKTIWRRVGARVVVVAAELFEESRKTLVGDGTYAGFVSTVLDRVPTASTVSEEDGSFGYPIYVQTGPKVTRRAADIKPGDIITLREAKLKGYKGIKPYDQTVGKGTPVVAIVAEYRSRKSTVKAYQANQQIGDQVRCAMNHTKAILMRPPQTVELVSYRLEDLKSGSIKISRVLECGREDELKQ